jgi:antitoxin (DNA-binding transcriptional repressor) of toxin-antitoxin stability system
VFLAIVILYELNKNGEDMRYSSEINLTKLRNCLGDTVKSVWTQGRACIIKSHDKPIAAIVPIEALEKIKAYDALIAKERLADSQVKEAMSKPKSTASLSSILGEKESTPVPQEVIETQKLDNANVEETYSDLVALLNEKNSSLKVENRFSSRLLGSSTSPVKESSFRVRVRAGQHVCIGQKEVTVNSVTENNQSFIDFVEVSEE